MTAWESDIDLKAIADQITEAAPEALLAGADLLLERSNALVPVESGALKDTGRTSADGLEAVVTYGEPGQRTGFAAIQQHEHTEYHHPSGGQAKFLEQPFLSETQAIGEAIASALRKALGSE